MDIGVFAFVTIIILIFGILAIIGKDDLWIAFAFFGGMLGMLFFTSLNSDGVITLAYAYTSSFQTQTTGIWPLGYLPLLFTILDFFIGIYKSVGHLRF